ncbi:hypothetical protein ACFW6C_07470 [Streptomyces fungicidicus]|uniref:hypothetical protein n=1 Tax=Streptomyces fungicidicus TaxID=68203 RepID=UPI0036C33DE8
MSVPEITNAREYGEAIAELFALARPDGKARVADLLTGIVGYTQADATRRERDRLARQGLAVLRAALTTSSRE